MRVRGERAGPGRKNISMRVVWPDQGHDIDMDMDMNMNTNLCGWCWMLSKGDAGAGSLRAGEHGMTDPGTEGRAASWEVVLAIGSITGSQYVVSMSMVMLRRSTNYL